MPIIKPTVGRKLWYRHNHHDRNIGTETKPPMTVNASEPLDATVVAVWGDRCVNLVIFDIYGSKYERRSVTLKQEGDNIPDGMAYAEWMPYQIGQAAPKPASGTVELESQQAESGDWEIDKGNVGDLGITLS